MHPINRCELCGKLTTLSLCPHCDKDTAPFFVDAGASHSEAQQLARGTAQKPPFVELTLADISAIAQLRPLSTSPASADAEEELSRVRDRLDALQKENTNLYQKLALDRQQMLRSARAIREVHATTNLLRQRDQAVMAELRRENALLRSQLAEAAAGPPDATLQPSRSLESAAKHLSTTPPAAPPAAPAAPLTSAAAADETATTPPPVLATFPPPPFSAKTREGGSAESVALHLPDDVLSVCHLDDVPALQTEVKRLQAKVARTTAQLDGLWGRVAKAERYIVELLGQLGYAQDLTEDEARNSARLSRHLAYLGAPPEDIVGFMAIKDRRSNSRSTPTTSLAPSSISLLERRNNAAIRASLDTN